MSDHACNELRKSDKNARLGAIIDFRNEFNKINSTGARMLASTYHIGFKYSLLESHLWCENVKSLPNICGAVMVVI